MTAYAPKKPKDFWALESLLQGGKEKPKAQARTPDEQNQAIKMLHLMFGGTLEEIREAEHGGQRGHRGTEG
jgi:hypothetical protein